MTVQAIEGDSLRVGVALSAGSAASMAQIGALEVIREAGIPVCCVAGTSAGAIVGAAFAAGRLDEFRRSLEALSRRRVLRLFDLAWPREGLLHGRRALELIGPHLGDDIESLELPFAAVATDLRRGEEVTLVRGPVFDAVRASIAIPGIFTPWRVDGRLLVDGGLVNPIPVSTARGLGAEFVIALNVLPLRDGAGFRAPGRLRVAAAPDAPDAGEAAEQTAAGAGEAAEQAADDTLGLVDIVSQASGILASQVASHRLRADRPGYLLQIPVPALGMFDVHRTAELAEVGRRCAEQALPELRKALARAVPLGRRLRAWQRRAGALLALSSGGGA